MKGHVPKEEFEALMAIVQDLSAQVSELKAKVAVLERSRPMHRVGSPGTIDPSGRWVAR